MRHCYLLIISFIFFSFGNTSLKKRISDTLFRYEFYTTDNAVEPDADKEYFWFKGGKIHSAQFGVGGELLHEEFLKFYHSNQLAEAGKFKNGLKTGIWKEWYKTGVLQTKTYWNSGQRDGSYYAYDHTGVLVESGKFKNNKKHGTWINYTRKDTLKYKNDNIVVKKTGRKKGVFSFLKKKEKVKNPETLQKDNRHDSLTKKPGFFNRLFTKKEKAKNNNKKLKGALRESNTQKEPSKDGFFKRLFAKKDKKQGNR